MRITTALIAAVFVAACGKGNGKGGDTSTGVPEIPEIHFGDRVSASSIAGELSSETELAQKAVNTTLGAVGLAFADESVRGKMLGHVDGNRSSHCWNGPLFPLSTFTLDYTPCEDAGIRGGMIFNEDPLGPVSMNFQGLTFSETRTMSGAMGFDATGAGLSRWTLYDTVHDQPIPANRSPFSLELDGRQGSLVYDGGAFMRSVNQNTAMWGVLQYTPYGGAATEILVGGSDATALRGPSEPAEPASLSFGYLTCRCPTAGLLVMDVAIDVSELRFDLDDLKLEDDGVDDPEVKVDATSVASGATEIRYVDCGAYEATFTGDTTLEVSLGSTELRAAVQHLCDTAVITDSARCNALLMAADEVSEVVVEVGTNKIGNAISDEVAVGFDTAYCRP